MAKATTLFLFHYCFYLEINSLIKFLSVVRNYFKNKTLSLNKCFEQMMPSSLNEMIMLHCRLCYILFIGCLLCRLLLPYETLP